MTLLRDRAKAKLNLTLTLHGKRADGYHEIESLAVFAGLADSVAFSPGGDFDLAIDGPFAVALDGENLMLAAARAASHIAPDLPLGRFHLTKELPVAAGLGGGSADAAAVLRLLQRSAPDRLAIEDLPAIARTLGADVSACLKSRSVVMRGRGEELAPVTGLPACTALLVNPRLPLSAGEVYAALACARLAADFRPSRGPLAFGGSLEELFAYLAARGNDLQPAAMSLAPVIGDVLGALAALPGAAVPRLSGSGPTCFALFADTQMAEQGQAKLAADRPGWWSAVTSIGAET